MRIETRAPLLALLAAVAGCAGGSGSPGASGASDDAEAVGEVAEASAETAGATEASVGAAEMVPATEEIVTVYKSPTCGCCSAWVEHMREAGFEVEAHDVNDLSAVKAEYGVRPQHQACHTAKVGDYVVEGHVPADLVQKLLREQADVAGLAVPGMPRGSPGMEMPDGTKDAYDVIAFTADGESSVYASR